MKITFLDASTVGNDIDLSIYERFGDFKAYVSTSEDEVVDHIADSDAIIINKVKVGRQNLPACKNLRLICITATGFASGSMPVLKSALPMPLISKCTH